MINRYWTYLLTIILMSACSANKYLPENEKYFEGHEIKFLDDKEGLPKDVENILQNDLKPKITRSFLSSRPGVWIFEVMGTPKKEKGIKHWVKYKLGVKPTYISQFQSDRSEAIILSKLIKNGFFRAKVTSSIDTTKNAAKAIFQIELNAPYYIDSVQICDSKNKICALINEYHRESKFLKKGELFRSSRLKQERKDLTRHIRNEGYFYFSPDYLYFRADSNDGKHVINLGIELKDGLLPNTLQPYTLKDATVNLAVNSANTVTLGDSLRVVVDTLKLFIKPLKLKPFIAYQPGKLYSKADEELTLKQLNRLEVFEFVNVQYTVDTSETGQYKLSANLLATPRKKHSLSTEFSISNTSTNFTGPGLQTEYYNRNLFGGAEKLRVTATGRYETQLSGSRKGLDSYEIDVEASILIPSVSGPLKKRATGNVPKTKYRLQYRLYDQPDYYAQTSASASFGYEWLKGNTIHNEVRLISFDFVKLLKSSDRLEELLEDGILSPESFEDQIILGSSYRFVRPPQSKPGKKARFFLGLSGELAGNLLNGINNWTDQSKNENGQYTFASIPFAQYVRAQVDLRTYIKWTKFNELVLRQNFGIGIPYGNSSSLPFSKQFFVGGASSLRGFQPRSVGPGTYNNEEEVGNDSYFDRSGDILIELNFENRVNLGQYLEGAIFMDIGNVWLKNASDSRPGGDFKWNSFMNEFAIDAGLGIRLNFDFVILRLDLAIPLRIPYLQENDRWVVDEISISKSYRKDNLIWNIAIGYPF